MRVHLLNDIHLEFGPWPNGIDINAIDADVTVLAGDIGVGLEGLEWALAIERPVIYVMGNHEFYDPRPMDELWRGAREMVANTQVTLLENEAVILDDPHAPGERVRFLGATLWTDFALLGAERQEDAMRRAAKTMSDYNSIHVSHAGYRSDMLTPRQVLSIHHDSRDFLEQELSRMPDPLGVLLARTWTKTVVVTHHAPSKRSLMRDQPTEGGATYASNLDHLVGHVDLWVHGHTHIPVDYQVAGPSGGRVVSNPRGYVGHGLVRGFDPNLVIEV